MLQKEMLEKAPLFSLSEGAQNRIKATKFVLDSCRSLLGDERINEKVFVDFEDYARQVCTDYVMSELNDFLFADIDKSLDNNLF